MLASLEDPIQNLSLHIRLCWTEGTAVPQAEAPGSVSALFDRNVTRSFVGLRGIAQQAVNRSSLGGTQVDVVFGGVLKSDKECLRAAQGVRVELCTVLESELVSKLADERAVLAAGTPDGHIGLAGKP